MLLSILICSHKSRKQLCYQMMESLSRQILNGGYLMKAEILFEINTAVMSRGFDRNKLLERATGEYCCFVDDDDVVSLKYVDNIIAAIKAHKDCDVFGIKGIVTSLATNEVKRFELSIHNEQIFSLPSDEHENDCFRRYINHLNPIKTEIAKKIRFPLEMLNEDNGYTNRLISFESTNPLKEIMIPETLYYYYNRCRITSHGVRI